jgi:hypothetical protein
MESTPILFQEVRYANAIAVKLLICAVTPVIGTGTPEIAAFQIEMARA